MREPVTTISETCAPAAGAVWAEAWVRSHWLPMCPFNHHYSQVPSTYLVFGFGDLPVVQGHHVRDLNYACLVEHMAPEEIINAVQANLKIKSGETTADNKVSLLTARCIGACGIAPAVVYDGTVTPHATPESTLEKIKEWVSK